MMVLDLSACFQVSFHFLSLSHQECISALFTEDSGITLVFQNFHKFKGTLIKEKQIFKYRLFFLFLFVFVFVFGMGGE